MTSTSEPRWIHLRRESSGALDRRAVAVSFAVPARVVLVDPYYGLPPGAATTPLLKVLGALSSEDNGVDAIVFRGVPTERLVAASQEIAEFTRNQWEKEVEVGGLELNDQVLRYAHATGPKFGLGEYLHEMRHVEMRALLDRAGAIHRRHDAHFALPSGWHADAYVRVADAFDEYASVERAADWLAHRVDGGTVLVGDTWTILPLLQELACRVPPSNERGAYRQLPIVTFPWYPSPHEIRSTIGSVQAFLTSRPNGKALFVLSAASSGELVANLRTIADRQLTGSTYEIVALANTSPGTVSIESLCVVNDVTRYPAAGCALCSDGSRATAIQIDSKRFFPVVSSRREERMITADYGSAHRAFWELVDRHDAVRLHAYLPEGVRLGEEQLEPGFTAVTHREIAFDVVALLRDRQFVEQVRDSLASFAPRSDLVIVPNHRATDILLEQARMLYPGLTQVVAKEGWIPRLREALPGARRILILDDAIVSGHTIRSIHRVVQQEIHDLPTEDRPAEDYEIRAFAVICRPHSERQLARLRDSFRQRGSDQFVGFAYKLLLPDTGCVWCSELDTLRAIKEAVIARHVRTGSKIDSALAVMLFAVERRIETIAVSQSTIELSGLREGLFFCDRFGAIGPSEADRLTPKSLFGDVLREHAAFGAVTAAMHAIRLDALETTQRDGATSWEWDIGRIITLYHDPILQASMLRAARGLEIKATLSPDLERAIEAALMIRADPARRVSPMLAAEHLWAAATHKYPQQMREQVATAALGVLGDWAAREGTSDHVELYTVATQVYRELGAG